MGSTPATISELAARFEHGRRQAAEGIALTVGGKSLTFDEVHHRAMCLAARILRAVPAPRRVGLLVKPGEDLYIGLLAIVHTGAAVVPLNVSSPPARVVAMSESARLCAVVTDETGDAVPEREELPPMVPVSSEPGADDPPPLTEALERADETAYIMFTSGSTGAPKGVPVSHGNIASYLDIVQRKYGFTARDAFSQTFSLAFDLAMFDLFAAWQVGARLVPIPPLAYLDLPAFLTTHSVTVWFSTPSTVSLVRRGRELERGSMPTLRWSFFCGEALMREDAEEWRKAADNAHLENVYGPTELTLACTAYRWSDLHSPAACVNGIVPIGHVHEGHDHVLLDRGGEVTADEGELCVTGPQMFSGYLDPSHDEGRFLVHRGRRWYRTGDQVRRTEDSGLVYLGRNDHQVQIRGARIELAEVEFAFRRCDGVEDTVAVPVGQGLLMFYTGTERPEKEYRNALARILPPYMLPSGFRHLGSFPRNANSKIDRSELRRMAGA